VNKKLKALGVALLGARRGVRFTRKGRAVFNGLAPRLARLVSPFYDVRRTRSGRVYFNLRDKRTDKKVMKKFRELRESMKERAA